MYDVVEPTAPIAFCTGFGNMPCNAATLSKIVSSSNSFFLKNKKKEEGVEKMELYDDSESES